jgi:hypothetical protein
MPAQIARYSVTFGLRGCYMPDSVSGPLEFATRRDLLAFVRSELEFYDLPKTAIRQVRARRLWAHIARHGSSCAHFAIHHGANALEFHGLTEAEAEAMGAEADQ